MSVNGDDTIEVDLYVMGVYKGKRKVGKNSIAGLLISGDLQGAMTCTAAMVEELNQIPGVQATCDSQKGADDGT